MRADKARVMDGHAGKFISATHMGMTSKPARGAAGAKPPGLPMASSAKASCPALSITVVKSNSMNRSSPSPEILHHYLVIKAMISSHEKTIGPDVFLYANRSTTT